MPGITNFAFCNNDHDIQIDPNNLNVLEVIKVNSDTFSFGVFFSLTGYDSSVDHACSLYIIDSTGEELFTTGEINIEKDEEGDEDFRAIHGISLGLYFGDITFRGRGLYTVKIHLDNEQLGEFKIPVIFEKED